MGEADLKVNKYSTYQNRNKAACVNCGYAMELAPVDFVIHVRSGYRILRLERILIAMLILFSLFSFLSRILCPDLRFRGRHGRGISAAGILANGCCC
jgi:hypothetical protein